MDIQSLTEGAICDLFHVSFFDLEGRQKCSTYRLLLVEDSLRQELFIFNRHDVLQNIFYQWQNVYFPLISSEVQETR